MPCCGRADPRKKKAAKDKTYFDKYAYLSSHQKEEQLKLQGSECKPCGAITLGAETCAVCGVPKAEAQPGA